jgi:hypothetical protein
MSVITAADIKARMISLLSADTLITPLFPNSILSYNPKAPAPEGTAGAANASPCLCIDVANEKQSWSTLGPPGTGKSIKAYTLGMLIFVSASAENAATRQQIEQLTGTALEAILKYTQDTNWYHIGFGPVGQPQPIESEYIYSPAGFWVSITPFCVYRQYIRTA